MKRFAIKLAIFLAPILVLLIGAEHRLARIQNSYKDKWEILQNSPGCEVLVLGSSHALQGINPAFFRHPGINMANSAQLLYHDTQILKQAVVSLPNLKYVIFSVSYFSLESNLGDGPEYWRTFFYRQYYGIPSDRWRLRWDIRNFSKFALYGDQSLKYLKSLPKDLAGPISSNGWFPTPSDTGLKQDLSSGPDGKKRVLLLHQFMREEYRQKNVRCLRDGIELCLHHGIIPILLTTPVNHTYSDYIDGAKYLWMQETLRGLCAEYRIRYLNYFMDPRFTIEDFGDHDHLTVQGAEKLSRIIDEDAFGDQNRAGSESSNNGGAQRDPSWKKVQQD